MKVLFIGDSITDAGRMQDENGMGNGYALFASQLIRSRHPDTEFEFINRGIGGNKMAHLVERWQEDCIDLKPDVVSVLIGINNTLCRSDTKNWYDNDEFEAMYRGILTDVKEKTNAKIIMLEQFLVPMPYNAYMREDVDPKIQITRRLALEFADAFIPTDGLITAECVRTYPICWSHDGVHPTEACARFIAEHYANAFDQIFNTLNKE